MALVITVNEVVIDTIRIDYQRNVVIVSYTLLQDTGEVWKKGEAYFWVELPAPTANPDGSVRANPDNWFQLPSEYFSTLLSLQTDADTALTNAFLS